MCEMVIFRNARWRNNRYAENEYREFFQSFSAQQMGSGVPQKAALPGER
jgi:hypothetical protein